MKQLWMLLVCLCSTILLQAQTNFYAEDTIQEIHVFISNPAWDFQMDTAKMGQAGYTFADSVIVNGVKFDSVGVRYKGNSSYDSASKKNPWHLELDHFKPQDYAGVKDIKLSNMYKDPSLIREFIAYKFAHKCMKSARANFAKLFVNGNYIGIYTNVQQLNNAWAKDNIGSDGQAIIKCNPTSIPGLTTKSNFKKSTTHDSASYAPYYEMKSAHSFQTVLNLIDSINSSTNLRTSTNIDGTLWMLAFNDVFANLDSYTGVFAQNHYAFKDNYNRFHSIIWDLNMCFGGFPYLGNQNTSLSAQNINGLKNLSLFPHNGDTYWPLINRVYADPELKREYLGHIKTLSNWIDSASTWIAQAHSLIDTAVQADSNLAYGYATFNNALTTDVNVGNYSVPALQTFLDARKFYVDSAFTANYTVPTIGNVNFTGLPLKYDTSSTITVACTNEQAVYFCLRHNSFGPFYRVKMFDDGSHGDGAAGDHNYGVAYVPKGAYVQYYILAEGANTNAFSPEGAEHSYFELPISLPVLTFEQIHLSEVMPNNTLTAKDSNGQYDDWVELNSYESNIPMCALYLSDDANQLKKWQFPSDASFGNLSQYDLPIIWCDNDVQQQGMHANFKLNDSAAAIYLSDINGVVIDSMRWPSKIPVDLTMLDCFGSRQIGTKPPTFKIINCPSAISQIDANTIDFLPNPATNFVQIVTENNISKIEVFNLYGQTVLQQKLNSSKQFSVQALAPGTYIILIDGVVTKKLVKL
jgi:CotH kinase protein/Secretion system C-terminal sorting domain